MKLIFGLGNPGKEYERTRHNAGFIMLNEYVGKKGLKWVKEDKFKAETAREGDSLFIKPQTFMNNSGDCVSLLLNYYKSKPDDVLVVHDDVDLEFGRTKKQLGGGSAGHHGIEDIVLKLGTKVFWRFRVGVGRPAATGFDVMDWVLSTFSDEELEAVKNINFIG
jgi:PTH1 family peptidyl-tRNA hydrolase